MNDNQIKGLYTVENNQQGNVIRREGYNPVIEFFCPICEQNEWVHTECPKTMEALKNIGKNSINQLICASCGDEIFNVKWNFYHQDRMGIHMRRVYQELGWID